MPHKLFSQSSKNYKRISLSMRVFIVFVAIFLPITQTFAKIDNETLKFYAKNNILYYDPTGNTINCNESNYSSKPTGGQITWIGDSYSVGARTIIEEKLPGVDIHAQGSKHFEMHADSSNGGDSGLEILAQLKSSNQLRPYLVFALGTNDPVDKNAMLNYISMLEDDNHAGNDTKIVLVTAYTKKNIDYSGTNAAYKEASQTYNNIFVADWAAVAKDEYYTSDPEEVHPTANGGYQAWVDAIYNALPGSAAGLVAGNNNGEKVWNYLVSKGISNPAVIAGILGNMAQETGGTKYETVDPFVAHNGYYGLFQTTDDGLQQAVESQLGNSLWYYGGSSKATEAQIDQAISIELDWLIANAGHGMGKNFYFFDLVSSPDISNIITYTEGENGAASFAELFLVTVERAVHGSYTLTDQKLQAKLTPHFYDKSVCDYGDICFKYQEGATRVREAKRAYNDLASSSVSGSSTPAVSSATSTSDTYSWNNGWLSSLGSVTVTKEDATSWTSDTIQDSYETSGPNKILLHNTEGTTSGAAAYPTGSAYPSHFTIDLVKKQVSQHIPITKPATGIASHDKSAGVQIEIVGWSKPKSDPAYSVYSYNPPNHDTYYLQNFTAEQWDFLVILLNAISSETGIPLTSSVDWSIKGNADERLSVSEFKNYTGVLGHMHAPDNNHDDPGNIWHFIQDAIGRNPSASSFATGSNNPCLPGGSGALVSGGFKTTTDANNAIMNTYRNLPKSEWSKYNINSGDGCKAGRLHNCVSFVRYFVTRYSDVDISSVPGHGCQIVNQYKDLPGVTYGGTTPKVYAIFSRNPIGDSQCGDGHEGHTGVVLGIDEANDKIIIGEAGCNAAASWTGAHEYKLSEYTDGTYTYVYLNNLKGL